LSLSKLAIFSSLILFSCSNYLTQGEKIIPTKLYCDSTIGQILDEYKQFISKDDENFEKVLIKINNNLGNKGYNLLVTSGPKKSSGYELRVKNIIKKNNIVYLNFDNIHPKEKSKNLSAVTYPFCLIEIKNLDDFKIFIN
jgi:hypothetical protein